ncbi:MAG: glycosyl hydrolase [Rhodocyclales bacterium]|nr:glycosyl hydrolase [Rhodocyclales bacterium]
MPKLISSARVAAMASVLMCGPAWSLTDAIDRPSIASVRAAQSLLLAVTRAGHRLVAAGERGIVLLSDDSGVSWRQAPAPVSVTLTSAHFVTEKDGWITGHGGILLHTTDGGETWSKRFDGKEVAKTILAAELAKGPAAEPNQLADAQRLVADGPDKPFLDVWFASPQRGFVVGAYGLFLRTEDGGKTWLPWQARLQNLRGRHLTRIAALNGELYIVGEQGTAYLSLDGGETFKELQSPYRGSFFGAAALPSGDVIIFGLRGNAFRVRRHGTEWAKVATPTQVTCSASTRLASGKIRIASQTGDLLGSADDGLSLAAGSVATHMLTAAIAEAPDGTLVVAGRGISRLFLNHPPVDMR